MLPPARARAYTVQSFPPPNNTGLMIPWGWDMARGPILPVKGSKERDRILRLYDEYDYNNVWQGARAGICKKVATLPFEITGPPDKVQYFQDMLGYAHFGHGAEYFFKLGIRDFLTQSFGWIVEIAGPGEPDTPLQGAPWGINHLDSSRCYLTGNPDFPVLYYGLYDGRFHRMHASRVYIMVDEPTPDERYFGIGNCALERAIAVCVREIRMGQYVDALLDDKPQPGILSLTGVSDNNWQALLNKYMMEQSGDERPTFGRVIVLTSLDPNAAVTAQVVPFSQTPEKFDFARYKDVDVSEMAVAIGIDRQEMWELSGKSLGTGAQSETLSIKSRGKLYGSIQNNIEHLFNWAILPEDCEFKFKEQDVQADQAQADIDTTYAGIAQTLRGIGYPIEIISKLLADKSQSFKDALTDEQGKIALVSADPQTPAQVATEAAADSATPIPAQVQTPPRQLPATVKSYDTTKAQFVQDWTSLIHSGLGDELSRRTFGITARAELYHWGKEAFTDGLRDGGVDDALDEDDLFQIQKWVSDQSQFVTAFADTVYREGLDDTQVAQRADMWANKSLGQMYNAGLLSADANGMYEFVGDDGAESCPTCQRLKGQVHRFKVWDENQLIPGIYTDTFDCKGYQCKHKLVPTKGKARGRLKDFDPSQARDDSGKWSETGAGGSSGGNAATQNPSSVKPVDEREWGKTFIGNPEAAKEVQRVTGKSSYEFLAASGAHEISPRQYKNLSTSVQPVYDDSGKVSGVSVEMFDAKAGLDIKRTFHYKGGKPDYVENNNFYLDKAQTGKGTGTRVFSSQVEYASAMGFKKIKTVGGKSEYMNGYYTWPRLGYDAKVTVNGKQTRLSDLMKTKQGRDYWKANGVETAMEFNLSKTGRSRKILANYKKERFGSHDR